MKASTARAHVQKIRPIPTKEQGSQSPEVLERTEHELTKIYAGIKRLALQGEFHTVETFEVLNLDTILVVDNIVHTLIRQGYHVSIIQNDLRTHLHINWD